MTRDEDVGLKELHKGIKDLGCQYKAPPDQVFTYWYIVSTFTGWRFDDLARSGVHGGPNDKGLDGAYVDHTARRAYLVQTKYRDSAAGRREDPAGLEKFTQLARKVLLSEDGAFREFLKQAKPDVAERLREVRRLASKEYDVDLHYVTLGTIAPAALAEAVRETRDAGARLTVVTFSDVLRRWTHFHETLESAPPTFTLSPADSDDFRTKDLLNVADDRAHLSCWAFPVRGDQLGKVFRDVGPRLFARNIRGYLGERAQANAAMQETLRHDPQHFFYYNNGVTIIADRATWEQGASDEGCFRIELGQVINGQQTIRTLAEEDAARRATVMVKLIALREYEDRRREDYRRLVSNIVEATNKQSSIRSADLMANDSVQVGLQLALHPLRYAYIRKRGLGSDMGGRGLIRITKEELAQAVAGCELDPVDVRSGKDKLFEPALYGKVFPSVDPFYYLPRWWLFKHASARSRLEERRGYAKWLVLGYVWRVLTPYLRSERSREAFTRLCRESDARLMNALGTLFDRVFVVAHQFYLDRRKQELQKRQKQHDRLARQGKEAGVRPTTPAELSGFYRARRGRDEDFATNWAPEALRGDKRYRRALDRAVEAIRRAE